MCPVRREDAENGEPRGRPGVAAPPPRAPPGAWRRQGMAERGCPPDGEPECLPFPSRPRPAQAGPPQRSDGRGRGALAEPAAAADGRDPRREGGREEGEGREGRRDAVGGGERSGAARPSILCSPPLRPLLGPSRHPRAPRSRGGPGPEDPTAATAPRLPE